MSVSNRIDTRRKSFCDEIEINLVLTKKKKKNNIHVLLILIKIFMFTVVKLPMNIRILFRKMYLYFVFYISQLPNNSRIIVTVRGLMIMKLEGTRTRNTKYYFFFF